MDTPMSEEKGVPYGPPQNSDDSSGTRKEKKSVIAWLSKQIFWMLCFAPLVIFMVLKSRFLSLSLGLAALCSLAVVTLRVVGWYRGSHKDFLDSLNACFLAVFAVLFILSFFVPNEVAQPWFPVITMWWVSICVLVGILVGRPFVATYMKDSIPEEHWERQWFMPACVTFTLFWLATFVIISISNTVVATCGHFHKMTLALAIAFGYVVPLGALVTAMVLTHWYKMRLRNAYRQHQHLPG